MSVSRDHCPRRPDLRDAISPDLGQSRAISRDLGVISLDLSLASCVHVISRHPHAISRNLPQSRAISRNLAQSRAISRNLGPQPLRSRCKGCSSDSGGHCATDGILFHRVGLRLRYLDHMTSEEGGSPLLDWRTPCVHAPPGPAALCARLSRGVGRAPFSRSGRVARPSLDLGGSSLSASLYPFRPQSTLVPETPVPV